MSLEEIARNVLRFHKETRGATYEELAKQAKIAYSGLFRFMRGQCSMTLTQWDKVMQNLGLSPKMLASLLRDEEKDPSALSPNQQVQRIVFNERMPSLNEILEWQKYTFRKRNVRVSHYSEKKKFYTNLLVKEISYQGIKPVQKYPVTLIFHWYCENRKGDKDNTAAGGRKFILDALQVAGIIKNDGWNYVEGWQDVFFLADEPRVEVILQEATGT